MNRNVIYNRKFIFKKNIIVVGHVTEIYGPVQAIHNYLVPRAEKYTFITHPFSYCSIPRSEALMFQNGECKKNIRCFRIKAPKIVHYLKDIFFTIWCVFRMKQHINIYIGIDCLNAFVGLILKKLGKVDKVIFYVIDYTPKWVENKLLNFIYHLIDYICTRNSDQVWNLSFRIRDIRQRQGVPEAKNKVVPVGVELDKIRKISINEVRRKTFVVVSHLVKSKGIDLVLDVWQDVLKIDNEARLLIIGTGPYEKQLRKYTGELGLNDKDIFVGHKNHDELLNFLPICGVGLATYREDDSSFSWYADPTKPKEYLACGLPVVITRVPWIAEDIEKYKLGLVIKYKKDDLKKAIVNFLQNEKFYHLCRDNAINYSRGLSWDKIYSKAFEEIK